MQKMQTLGWTDKIETRFIANIRLSQTDSIIMFPGLAAHILQNTTSSYFYVCYDVIQHDHNVQLGIKDC